MMAGCFQAGLVMLDWLTGYCYAAFLLLGWLVCSSGNITALFREYNRALLFLPPLVKTTEGVVVGFQNFAWAPN